MRYMAGGSLSEQIKLGPISMPASLDVLRSVAAALGTFQARSGDQRVEQKFYVQAPNCQP